jgi:hypothetical protein
MEEMLQHASVAPITALHVIVRAAVPVKPTLLLTPQITPSALSVALLTAQIVHQPTFARRVLATTQSPIIMSPMLLHAIVLQLSTIQMDVAVPVD